MNRREMLQESFRSIARAVPAALGAAGELAGIIKPTDGSTGHTPASCFPARSTIAAADEAGTQNSPEE
jgi:hypothetical protein